MFSFKTYKDKRYWILLFPFLLILLLHYIFTLNDLLEKSYVLPVFIPLFVTIFWTAYHLWKYFGDKKREKREIN